MNTIFDTKSNIEAEAAAIIKAALKKCIESNGCAVLGIPGGRSVQGVFALLKDADVPWENVHIFMVDERMVPLDSPESNYAGAREIFIQPLIDANRLLQKNAHPFVYDESEPDGGVSRYTKEFLSVTEMFAVVLLGVGEDGHVASLFPQHPSVENNAAHFIVVENAPKPPVRRMSASHTLLSKTHTALLFFLDEEKQNAYQAFSDDTVLFNDCPAKIVLEAKNTYVFTDQKL